VAGVKVALFAFAGLALFASCGSGGDDDDDDPTKSGKCFPDSDGLTGGAYTIALTVTDTGFSKTVINSQNNAGVTLTLTNAGTTPHGFAVDCVSVLPAYPNLPAMCPSQSCFPDTSMIAPLAPGATQTITFSTPTPDGLIYPFRSSEPTDSAVPDLNDGQWTLM
jgi:hypothetical protein